jgi:peptidoglycan/LPS O-acetylase OafA/YrhL
LKSHLEVLDGLRGTAALSVLLFHITEIASADVAHNPLRHAHLAVDFFFALSGFVLGHAYDTRLSAAATATSRLTLKAFYLRRLIRLHPMVLVAMLIGLLGYLFDPYANAAQIIGTKLSAGLLIVVFALNLLLLPAPALPNRFGETHCIDSPAWTLFQEYLANIAYGQFGTRLSNRALGALCAASALALLLTALHFGNLSVGWAWTNFWAAFVRLIYPFLAGLLVYRLNLRVRLPHSYLWLSLVLVAVFTAPAMGRFDGLYEALCVIVIFPLTICLGAGISQLNGLSGQLSRFTGRLSYPLYIIHYPAIYVFAHWYWQTHPSTSRLWLVSTGLYVCIVIVAWLLLKYYDEPLRAWLTRKAAAAANEALTTRAPAQPLREPT